MTGKERLGVLRGVAELACVPDSALRSLVSSFDEVLLPAGITLAREGQLGHELFVVADGDVEVCKQGRTWRLRPGESFGWNAMRDRRRHDATAMTTSSARLLVMGHAQFRAVEALFLEGRGAVIPRVSAMTRGIAVVFRAFAPKSVESV